MRVPVVTPLVVSAAAAALLVATLPSNGAGAAPAGKPAIGDSCLIGTWHTNAEHSSTIWNGNKVKMHYRGGDIDHIAASGVDHDNWNRSKLLVGTVGGYRLTERIRGHKTVTVTTSAVHHHAGKLHVVVNGWSKGSTNRYTYQGQHYQGTLSSSGHSSVRYSCTKTTLTYRNKKGKVTGTETRLSKP